MAAKRNPTVILPPDNDRGVFRLHSTPRIIGAGGDDKGGSGSQRGPVESPDSLQVKQHAMVLDLTCEGPIDGPATGANNLRWVELDGTPLQNADGSFNFRDVTVTWVLGDPYATQGYITGFTDVEADTLVGAQVTHSTSVTRTITDSNADAVKVTIQIPQLTFQNTSTGDLQGNTVQIAVDVQNNGGGFVQQFIDIISGKSTKPYERAYRVELTGAGPWDIRVRRISNDDPGANYQSKTYWARYTKIIDKRFAYPNSAIVGVMANADQFTQVPTRSYYLKLLKVKVPVNYDPIARTYTGSWDGTFKIAWTDNPVWCWYDLVTNTRYGAGRKIKASNLDKWGLYTIAQYCDGWVPAGKSKRATLSITGLTLTAAATGNTITRSSGRWFQAVKSLSLSATGSTYTTTQVDLTTIGLLAGDVITVDGFRNSANNGSKTILSITATTITLTAGGLVDESSTAIITGPSGDGFQVGDEVTVAGFASAANNGRGRIASLSPTVMTLDEKTLVNEGPVGSCSVALQDFTEPRFTCNLYIQQAEEAINLIRNMASIFRAMVYLAGGILVPVQDAPSTVAAVFNRTNVTGGKFVYSGSAKLARHTQAIVTWNNPANNYKMAQELVMDEAGIARYGLNPIKLAGMGCTSQGQAQRIGRWALYSERLESETVTFGIGLDGAAVRPGDVIAIHDTQRAGRVLGGRVKSYTSPTVVLDREVVIESGKTYSLMVTNSTSAPSYTVTNTPGTYQTLTLSSPPSSLPTDAVWILSVSDLSPTTWRVLAVTEADKGYRIEALAHNPSKFAAVETGVALQVPQTTALVAYLPPQALTVGEYLINKAGDFKAVLQVSWMPPAGQVSPSSYSLKYRRDNGEWVDNDVNGLSWDLVGATTGTYDIRLAAVYNGKSGAAVSASYTVLGKTAPPANVANFGAKWGPTGLRLYWDKVPDLDFDHFEIRQGASWAAGTPIDSSSAGTFVYGTTYTVLVPTLPPTTYWIKAYDTSGNASTTAASVSPTNPSTTFASLTFAAAATRP